MRLAGERGAVVSIMARRPLVPAGDEDQLRINLERVVKLLGEAEAFLRVGGDAQLIDGRLFLHE